MRLMSATLAVNYVPLPKEIKARTPVILVHGGLANADYWGEVVRALASQYRVVVMDSRGHGRSSRDARSTTTRSPSARPQAVAASSG